MYCFLRRFDKINIIYIIIITIIIHFIMCLYKLNCIEFFGEDEAETTMIAARTILGIKSLNPFNLDSLLHVAHPPMRYLIQMPFLSIFGVNEYSMYMPNIIASILIYYTLILISKAYLKRSGLIILSILYVTTSIFVINRSLNAHGCFILFVLLSFYFIERFVIINKTYFLFLSWLFLALSIMTYVEGILFMPYLLFRFFKSQQNSFHLRKYSFLLKTMIPLFIVFILFIVVYVIVPYRLMHKPSGMIEHILQRKGGVWLIGDGVIIWIKNYYHVFSPIWIIYLMLSTVLLIYQRLNNRKMPCQLALIILFFGLHTLVWILLMRPECGHTLYGYPALLLIISYSMQEIYINCKSSIKKEIFILCIISFSFLSLLYSHWLLIDQIEPKKRFLHLIDFSNRLPCGINLTHKIGLKSLGFIIRQESKENDYLLTNIGSGINYIYADNKNPDIHLDQFVKLIEENDKIILNDLYNKYSIRYLAISPAGDSFNKINNLLIKKSHPRYTFVDHKGTVCLLVWDFKELYKPDEILLADHFDKQFDQEFSSIEKRFASWINYRPQKYKLESLFRILEKHITYYSKCCPNNQRP